MSGWRRQLPSWDAGRLLGGCDWDAYSQVCQIPQKLLSPRFSANRCDSYCRTGMQFEETEPWCSDCVPGARGLLGWKSCNAIDRVSHLALTKCIWWMKAQPPKHPERMSGIPYVWTTITCWSCVSNRPAYMHPHYPDYIFCYQRPSWRRDGPPTDVWTSIQRPTCIALQLGHILALVQILFALWEAEEHDMWSEYLLK